MVLEMEKWAPGEDNKNTMIACVQAIAGTLNFGGTEWGTT